MKHRDAGPSAEFHETPKEQRLPIIDIVRHGSTEYKELRDPSFRFDPDEKDFTLDEQHLDLNARGVEEARSTGRDLASRIDREQEVVLMVSSPNYRALSTALLIREELQKAGITVLGLHTSSQLRQISLRDPDMTAPWIRQDTEFRNADERNRSLPPMDAHRQIAEQLGSTIAELFKEDYPDMHRRFQRFFRHMVYIQRHFQPKTQQRIGEKHLRIISTTHEEVPAVFLQKTFDAKENLKKGQVLEIRPDTTQDTQDQLSATVQLYPKGEHSESAEAHFMLPLSAE